MCAFVHIKSVQSHSLLLRLTVYLHVNLIKKQCKPLNKHVSSTHLVLLLHSVVFPPIRLFHLSSPSVPLDARLSPCVHSFRASHPSLSLHILFYCMCSFPIPLLLFLHLSLLSSITVSSSPHFLSLSFPASFLECEWWVCGALVIWHLSRHPSAGTPDKLDGQQADRMTKDNQRSGQTDSYCS